MSGPSIYEHLIVDSDVAALIGDRIFPQRIPQHVFGATRVMPCAVYQLAGNARQALFCGTDGLAGGAYQIDIYAPILDDVALIADAIRRRMVDYSGPMGTALVSKVLIDNEFDLPPDPDPGLFRRTQLYSIWFLED